MCYALVNKTSCETAFEVFTHVCCEGSKRYLYSVLRYGNAGYAIPYHAGL